MPRKQITANVRPEILELLKKRAESHNWSMAKTVEIIVERFFDDTHKSKILDGIFETMAEYIDPITKKD